MEKKIREDPTFLFVEGQFPKVEKSVLVQLFLLSKDCEFDKRLCTFQRSFRIEFGFTLQPNHLEKCRGD